jgi:hypothetical protein
LTSLLEGLSLDAPVFRSTLSMNSKSLFFAFALIIPAWADPVAEVIGSARTKHGESGAKAARFLTDHMPARDRTTLRADFLMAHLDQAMRARAEFPWAKAVPEDLFLNDVLPYAVFDETRENWRAMLLEKLRPMVREAGSASEAAQIINRDLFKQLNVHYHTGRKRPNQSLSESMESGRATCTGLSIILINACRTVGIPARAVGTPMWSNERGNHTWVEIWDQGWHFMGADEYDAKGLDRGWFTGDAAAARADDPAHAIYASSWKPGGVFFPLVWAPESQEVQALNITHRYANPNAGSTPAETGIRLFQAHGGERLIAGVRVIDENGTWLGKGTTHAGTSDLNDMPRFAIREGTKVTVYITMDGQTRELAYQAGNQHDSTIDAVWDELQPSSKSITSLVAWLEQPADQRKPDSPLLKEALSIGEAATALAMLGHQRLEEIRSTRAEEMERKVIDHEGKSMRWLEKTFGKAPAGGHSLWISMHGGGGAPPAVNDSQWRNQIQLYQPAEGIYIAPRAPTDTWNLWHEAHIDPMFQRLIDNFVAFRGVNPNKIYLMGYSAGGDGVWQLAPRMADRFAAAAMMAGHPNEATLDGLRNLPFALFMGANDAAYDRNKIAVRKSAELDELSKSNPGAYIHMSRIYDGLGHWMNRKDAESLPWMAGFERNPWPNQIIWRQDDVVHSRFYWLEIPVNAALAGKKITAGFKQQTITVDGDIPPGFSLRLSDRLLDLDQEIKIIVNQGKPMNHKPTRTAATLLASLMQRADIPSAASAVWVLPE